MKPSNDDRVEIPMDITRDAYQLFREFDDAVKKYEKRSNGMNALTVFFAIKVMMGKLIHVILHEEVNFDPGDAGRDKIMQDLSDPFFRVIFEAFTKNGFDFENRKTNKPH